MCQFVIRKEGVLYIRKKACYCLFCIAEAEMLRGITEWNGELYNINGCCMSVLGSVGSTENVYTFVRGTCERTLGPNVTRQIQTDRRNRNVQALALHIGDWVLFDSKMEDEPI